MKKLLNILLCLCLSIVYGKAQMLIVERERVKPKFEILNTDSIDLTSLKESDEKIYGMSGVESVPILEDMISLLMNKY